MNKKDKDKNIKYFIYARKSSESEDRQVNSIEDQLLILKEKAKRENLEIIDILSESGSGYKTDNRKVFTEMIERIKKGEADGILAWKLNRLARNLREQGEIGQMLNDGEIKNIKTVERDYYPGDNVLIMGVEFSMATQYSKDLGVDVKRGTKQKAERGWYPSHPPLGYKHVRDYKPGENEIETDDNFYLIKKVWDLLLTGNYNPLNAFKKIEDDYGLRTSKGKRHNKSIIYKTIRNTFYYGDFEFPKGSGNWYKGKHEAMITKQEFNKVQNLFIATNKKNNDTVLKDKFPFKGPLVCGECGSAITAERKRRITCDCKYRFSATRNETCPKCKLHLSEMKNPKIEDRIYYRCTKKKNNQCTEGVYTPTKIENSIKDFLSELTIPKSILDIAIDTMNQLAEKNNEIKQKSLKTTSKLIDKINNQLDSLLEMRMNNEIDSE